MSIEDVSVYETLFGIHMIGVNVLPVNLRTDDSEILHMPAI